MCYFLFDNLTKSERFRATDYWILQLFLQLPIEENRYSFLRSFDEIHDIFPIMWKEIANRFCEIPWRKKYRGVPRKWKKIAKESHVCERIKRGKIPHSMFYYADFSIYWAIRSIPYAFANPSPQWNLCPLPPPKYPFKWRFWILGWEFVI